MIRAEKTITFRAAVDKSTLFPKERQFPRFKNGYVEMHEKNYFNCYMCFSSPYNWDLSYFGLSLEFDFPRSNNLWI